MQSILSQARLIPKLTPPEQAGVTLQQIVSGSALETAGFRNGDLVRAINGVAVGRGIQGLRAALSRSGPSYQVEILRNGQPVVLNYDPETQ